MKRINLYVPEQHHDWLTAKSGELGISAAEIVRRALDAWIAAQEEAPDLFRAHVTGPVGGSLKPQVNPQAVDEHRQILQLLLKALKKELPQVVDSVVTGMAEHEQRQQKEAEAFWASLKDE